MTDCDGVGAFAELKAGHDVTARTGEFVVADSGHLFESGGVAPLTPSLWGIPRDIVNPARTLASPHAQ